MAITIQTGHEKMPYGYNEIQDDQEKMPNGHKEMHNDYD